jgi:hypothetical protein
MEELYRNLAIAMVCVFVTTFILIANLFACLLVLLCVVLTLVKFISCRFIWHILLNVFIHFFFYRFAWTDLCTFGDLQLTLCLALTWCWRSDFASITLPMSLTLLWPKLEPGTNVLLPPFPLSARPFFMVVSAHFWPLFFLRIPIRTFSSRFLRYLRFW